MSRRIRVLVALAVIALVSPLLPTAAAVHVLLDHDHADEPHGSDPERAVHGHSHPGGTPAHEHGLSAPALATSSGTRERAATALVLIGSVPLLSTVIAGHDPQARCDAVARASPTQSRTSVLRI
jgi:hypothetical protein